MYLEKHKPGGHNAFPLTLVLPWQLTIFVVLERKALQPDDTIKCYNVLVYTYSTRQLLLENQIRKCVSWDKFYYNLIIAWRKTKLT